MKKPELFMFMLNILYKGRKIYWNPHPKNPDRELGNIPNMLQQVEMVQEKNIEVRGNNLSKQLCVYKHSEYLSVFL
jgi:hypothetical protein